MKSLGFNENDFIIGIDLGNSTSTISYFDFNQMVVEIVDASGGYGKISIPTVVSYNLDSNEWIFGEYALLNKGFEDIIFENLIENLGKNFEYTIDNQKIKLTYILAKYLLFLIDNIKNINPNASIKGIVLAISTYISDSGIEELKEAFKLAQLDDKLIKIATDNECILKHYFYENPLNKDNILIIDYSNRQMRISIYEVLDDGKFKVLKTCFRNNLGQHRIYNIAKNLITNKFLEYTEKTSLTTKEKNQIEIFTHQQFDLIFHRKSILDTKLYYNFYYPPFQKVITKEEVFQIVSFFEQEINDFLNQIFNEIYISQKDIKNFILTGGGLEISFIERFFKSKFSIEKDLKGKAKRIISDGACIYACQEIGILPKVEITIDDLNIVKNSIGIFINKFGEEHFFPIILKNSFIWQESQKQIFNLNVGDKLDFYVYIEEDKKNYRPIQRIKIDLPDSLKRDEKTVRFLIEVKFKAYDEIILKIEDFGFGEIFPKTDFKEQFLIKL